MRAYTVSWQLISVTVTEFFLNIDDTLERKGEKIELTSGIAQISLYYISWQVDKYTKFQAVRITGIPLRTRVVLQSIIVG